jgi:hypothetical protein
MAGKDWLSEFIRDAQERNDRDRLGLLQYYHEGYQLREKDPDRSFLLFSEARQRASQLGAPLMALFFDKLRVTALLHFKRDYRNVLELAVQSALEVRKPQYAGFSERVGIFDNLIAAYLGIDPAGHADAIMQAIDYLDRELPQEPDSDRYLLLARRRMYWLDLDRYDEALHWGMKELELADRDRDRERAEHFLAFAYCGLCETACGRRDWDSLREWAEVGDDITRRVGHQVELAELLAWRALSARKAGDEDRALRLCRSASSRQKAQKMRPRRGYNDALCAYYELAGDLPTMLAVRERELKDVSGWGRFLSEARAHLNRCKLLARMGRPLSEELTAAREAAAKLRDPTPFLAELETIAKSV